MTGQSAGISVLFGMRVAQLFAGDRGAARACFYRFLGRTRPPKENGVRGRESQRSVSQFE